MEKLARVSRRRILKLAAAAGALGAAGLPGPAFAAEDNDEKRLYIGYSLHPTGPNSTAGTFDMSVRFEDSGASTVPTFTVTRIGNSDRGHISGRQQFAGQKGTIFTHFEGVLSVREPTRDRRGPVHYPLGHWSLCGSPRAREIPNRR